MTEFQNELVKEFEIPVRSSTQKIWMIRTESGKFYRDFTTNGYVALGWDKVPFSVIEDKSTTDKSKKEKISSFYPDETKPGLILSQLRIFYYTINVGDLVLIPSKSSKQLYIGKLGDVITNVDHLESEEDYDKCEYSHKRKVDWIKPISPNIDAYLNKALGSHQAITDVTKYSDLFYRNVFPYYIEGSSLHLTFQKDTDTRFSVCDSIQLQVAVIEIFQSVSKLYGVPDNSNTYKIKTAVGSPGIFEFIVENFNDVNIVAVLIILLVFGGNVSKDNDGNMSFSFGVAGIIERVNNLLNDKKNRQLTDVEIEKNKAEKEKILSEIKIDESVAKANVKKTNAEAKEIEANAKKVLAEARQIDAETQKTLSEITQEQIQASEENITEPMGRLQQISTQNDINISA